jgi:hypothetical protein
MRFSRKARGPSTASFDIITFMPCCCSISKASASGSVSVARRVARMRAHRERAVLGDALRDLLRLRERLAVGHDVVHEAELPGARAGRSSPASSISAAIA